MRPLTDTSILFITSRTAPTFGRVERRWLKVWEALHAEGATVLLICPPHSALDAPARERGVVIAPYRLDRFNLLRTRSRMRKYIRRYRPAIAHSTGYEADVLLRWAAKDLPVKVVSSTICGAWPPRGLGPFGSWVRRRLDSDTIGRCDAVLVDCQELADRMLATTELPAERIHVDPPSVKLTRVFEEAETVVALPKGYPLVGYAGTLQPSRGLLALTTLHERLSARFPHLRVVIAGEGPLRRALLPAADSGAIDLIGHVDSVPAVLGQLDVCVFPSIEGGTPTPLLEAAALGRPIVASRTPGIEELFAEGDEISLVEAGDPAALAGAVSSLLGDRERARAMGDRARVRVIDEYSSVAAVRRHLTLYRNL